MVKKVARKILKQAFFLYLCEILARSPILC
nr:MAG TPA: hypothetical protein [Caudoviricetes sp.]